MRQRLTVSILLLLIAPLVFCEAPELSSWFKSDPRAQAYREIEPQVSRTFDEAEAAGLPLRILMDKLREGAAKGVAADRLSTGLRAELERLLRAQAILERQPVHIADQEGREEAMKGISISLLAGLPPEAVEQLFALSRPPARGPQDAVAACAALIQIREMSRMSDTDILRLGAALLGSRLPSTSFRSIPSFFVKARARGIGEREILDSIVIKALASGGGLVQMEDQLRLELKRRGGR
jgi:hypothetical protein